MVKKVKKYLKFVVCCALILSLIAPSYAALSASDGSAFVTKAEFDSAMADFNARLTTFEAGINSKIDSQVTSYLDRNGIWNGQKQTFAGNKNYNDFDVLALYEKHKTDEDEETKYKKYILSYVYEDSYYPTLHVGASSLTYYTMPSKISTDWLMIDNIDKSGLLILDYCWRYVAQITSSNRQDGSWYKDWWNNKSQDPASINDGTDTTGDRGWGVGYISRDSVANIKALVEAHESGMITPTPGHWGLHNYVFYSLQHNVSFYAKTGSQEQLKATQVLFSSAPSQTGIQTVQVATNSLQYGMPPIACNYNSLRGQSQLFVSKGDKIVARYNHILGGRQASDYYVTMASLIHCLLWMYDAQVY